MDDDDNDTKKKLSLLDLLLQSKCDDQPLTEEEIREEVDTFMFAGHDTTTNGSASTIYQLSRHPDIHARVYEEIRSIFGDDPTAKLTYSKLQELKYTEMVIKETMRLMPPVPIIGRSLVEPTLINGVVVPAGTNITIPVYALHREADVFPEPNEFDPERFSPENSEHRNPYAYIPFSAGPRNCIGLRYAMLEIKAFIVKILLNFKLLPNTDDWEMKIWSAFVLEMNGVHLRLESRKITQL